MACPQNRDRLVVKAPTRSVISPIRTPPQQKRQGEVVRLPYHKLMKRSIYGKFNVLTPGFTVTVLVYSVVEPFETVTVIPVPGLTLLMV